MKYISNVLGCVSGPICSHWSTWRRGRVPEDSEAGMTTAEYAIGTLAAAAFAGLLLAIIKSGALQDLLLGILQQALQI